MVGKKVKLIGRTGEWVVIKEYLAAGFIPSVVCNSSCGRFQTVRRIVDLEV